MQLMRCVAVTLHKHSPALLRVGVGLVVMVLLLLLLRQQPSVLFLL